MAFGLLFFYQKNPTFHIYYTMYKEQVGDISSARASFPQCSCDSTIDLTENVNRQANMEKRMVLDLWYTLF